MEFHLHAIGIIHSPFLQKDQMSIQASGSQAIGLVELEPAFAEGLKDLDGFSHIILLYAFRESSGYTLRVRPFWDDRERGIFSTRHPCRPNRIGLSIVRLLYCKDAALTVEGVDVLDGTPLLDIKPFVPGFDVRTEVRAGWYETRSEK